MFLIGTIGTVLLSILSGSAFRKYRRELIEVGDAQTTLGVIGSVFLEGRSDILVSLSIVIPIGLLCWGWRGSLSPVLGSPEFISCK